MPELSLKSSFSELKEIKISFASPLSSKNGKFFFCFLIIAVFPASSLKKSLIQEPGIQLWIFFFNSQKEPEKPFDIV